MAQSILSSQIVLRFITVMVLVDRIEGHTNIVKNLVNSHFLYTFNNIAKRFWNAPPPLSTWPDK